MEIIVPVGISGSGKTRMYKKRYAGMSILSPDLIRKEITGSISDQSRNKDVFLEVDRRISDFVERGESFFYDATNVNTKHRKEFSERFRGTGIKVTYVVLPADVNESYRRIREDLKNGTDRSDVPISVLFRQKGMYNESIKSGFDGENVQEIIYIAPGELDD